MARTRATPLDPDRMTLADLRRALDEKESDLRELLARKDAMAQELEALGETLQAMLAGSDISASTRAAKAPRAATRRESVRADSDDTNDADDVEVLPKARKSRATGVVREGSLQTAIRSVLERVIGPLRVAEIVDAVLKAGYATKSANLNVIVSNRLAQMMDVEKVERGLYQLARPSAAAPTSSSDSAAGEAPPMAKAANA